ncbi:hypothetical protein WN48_00544 [Eufriesea mexicana]|nr:hypothetical protein WN48_00544 [Eufriesea mexicana]
MLSIEAQWLRTRAFTTKYNMNTEVKKILQELALGSLYMDTEVTKRVMFKHAGKNPWYFARMQRLITNTMAHPRLTKGEWKVKNLMNSDFSPALCVITQKPSSP